MMNVNGIAWFRDKDCAEIMSYKDSKKAIKAHVEPDWQQTMEELLQTGGGDFAPPILQGPSVTEAKKRKADINSQSRKQQKLLQAEQPKTIECTA